MTQPSRPGDSPGKQKVSPPAIGNGNPGVTSVRSFAAFENCEEDSEAEVNVIDLLEKQPSLGASVVDAVSSPITFKRIWEETETLFLDRQSSQKRCPDSINSNPERGRIGPVSLSSPEGPLSSETHSTSSSPRSLLSQATKSRENSASTSPTAGDAVALPGLRNKGPRELDELVPVSGDEIDPASFNLISPCKNVHPLYSLEMRSEILFSEKHLNAILKDQILLKEFTSFLWAFRAKSIPLLVYYLDALKVLKAIDYSNSLIRCLPSSKELGLGDKTLSNTINESLLARLYKISQTLVSEDLPAYITHTWVQTVAVSIKQRITNTLPRDLRDCFEGLVNVFCLTDPSRHDNPIVFASKEFHRMTQYGAGYALGRNCRFLQGPGTNRSSARRIKEHLEAGNEHCEVLLNYRRDGSPFMSLIMVAPLLDNRGIIRYHVSAHVDVSGLAEKCAGLEALRRVVDPKRDDRDVSPPRKSAKDEFRDLAKVFDSLELNIVQEVGGIHHYHHPRCCNPQDDPTAYGEGEPNRGLRSPERVPCNLFPQIPVSSVSRATTLFEHYLLVRPHPHLCVLFASPALRFPGMLQSSFMSRIGGPPAVREAVARALAKGRGVTARIRWVTRTDSRGKSRWIHCTPLVGSSGAVGVWMVVLVNDDEDEDYHDVDEQSRHVSLMDVKTDRQRPGPPGGDGVASGSGGANGGVNDNGRRPLSPVGHVVGEVEGEASTPAGGCGPS
ncbi:hypothetical protein F4811DRAFT_558688 [Daldinia bambusicola]|nr:hypothetical protein F4811DRAFT_558688 [Daldinia bambusicola]